MSISLNETIKNTVPTPIAKMHRQVTLTHDPQAWATTYLRLFEVLARYAALTAWAQHSPLDRDLESRISAHWKGKGLSFGDWVGVWRAFDAFLAKRQISALGIGFQDKRKDLESWAKLARALTGSASPSWRLDEVYDVLIKTRNQMQHNGSQGELLIKQRELCMAGLEELLVSFPAFQGNMKLMRVIALTPFKPNTSHATLSHYKGVAPDLEQKTLHNKPNVFVERMYLLDSTTDTWTDLHPFLRPTGDGETLFLARVSGTDSKYDCPTTNVDEDTRETSDDLRERAPFLFNAAPTISLEGLRPLVEAVALDGIINRQEWDYLVAKAKALGLGADQTGAEVAVRDAIKLFAPDARDESQLEIQPTKPPVDAAVVVPVSSPRDVSTPNQAPPAPQLGVVPVPVAVAPSVPSDPPAGGSPPAALPRSIPAPVEGVAGEVEFFRRMIGDLSADGVLTRLERGLLIEKAMDWRLATSAAEAARLVDEVADEVAPGVHSQPDGEPIEREVDLEPEPKAEPESIASSTAHQSLDERQLLESLADETPIANSTLRDRLAWSEAKYLGVRDELVARGLLERGGGKGGSVIKVGDRGGRLLAMLPGDGSAIGNRSLMRVLEWDGPTYWAVRDRLLAEGRITRGKGLGGSIAAVLGAGSAGRQVPVADARSQVTSLDFKDACERIQRRVAQALKGRGAQVEQYDLPEFACMVVEVSPSKHAAWKEGGLTIEIGVGPPQPISRAWLSTTIESSYGVPTPLGRALLALLSSGLGDALHADATTKCPPSRALPDASFDAFVDAASSGLLDWVVRLAPEIEKLWDALPPWAQVASHSEPGPKKLTAVRSEEAERDAGYVVALADSQYRAGWFGSAEQTYRSLIELAPQAAAGYVGLAWCASTRDDWETADNQFSEALGISADSFDADDWYQAGYAAFRLKKYPAAARHFSKALEINPGQDRALDMVGSSLQRAGRTDEAIAACRRYLDERRSGHSPLYRLVQLLAARGDYDEAIALVKRDVKADGSLLTRASKQLAALESRRAGGGGTLEADDDDDDEVLALH